MQTLNSSIFSSISFFPIVFDASAQNWALLIYFVLFFSIGFVWRSWLSYRATGVNPLVFPSDDSAQAYIGRTTKSVMALVFLYIVLTAFKWLPTLPTLWHTPLWLNVLAWLALIVAGVWLLLAQMHMGKSWRIGIDRHATDLVTHGLFKYSRNPIFLAMRCALFAFTVILGIPRPRDQPFRAIVTADSVLS